MKKLCMLVIMLFITQKIFAQQVGIGTLNPHPSAALHIDSDNKGVLFPRINLQSKSDNTTIPDPANGLVVFHNNSNTMGGRGLYINMGNGGSPSWTAVSELKLPYIGTASADNPLVQLENYAPGGAIKATAYGTGTGVYTESLAGLALEVNGKVKISGNGQAPGAGKVLTSDASGNATWQGAVAFSASGVVGGGSQKMPHNVDTKVPFATVDYDLGGNYKNANGSPHSTFIAPVNGIYHFDLSLHYLTPFDEDPIVLVSLIKKRNGTETVLKTCGADGISSNPGNWVHINVSTDCQLAADDQVYVTFFCDFDDYLDLQTPDAGAGFSGRLVIKL